MSSGQNRPARVASEFAHDPSGPLRIARREAGGHELDVAGGVGGCHEKGRPCRRLAGAFANVRMANR